MSFYLFFIFYCFMLQLVRQKMLTRSHPHLPLPSSTVTGIAKAVCPPLLLCHSTSGTHGYLAPEVYANTHAHGPGADYFALGVTLHELLVCSRPFDAAAIRHAGTDRGGGGGAQGLILPCGVGSSSSSSKYRHLALASLNRAPYLSSECKDFISQLLIFYPTQLRLGGLDNITGHAWFRSFEWSTCTSTFLYVPDKTDVFPRGACVQATEGDSPLPGSTHRPPLEIDFSSFSYRQAIVDKNAAGRVSHVPPLNVSHLHKQPPLDVGVWHMAQHMRSSFSLHSLEDGHGALAAQRKSDSNKSL